MFVNESIVIIGIVFGGILLSFLTMAILGSAKAIDTHPKAVSRSAPGWSSPVPATRIFSGISWAMFIIGAILVLSGETPLGNVLGIALVFAALLFSATAFLLSAAVISVLNKKTAIS